MVNFVAQRLLYSFWLKGFYMQLASGFILSTQCFDNANGISMVVWILSEQGPVKLISSPQKAVFFVREQDLNTVTRLFNEYQTHCEIKHISLKTFQQHPVVACHFSSLKHYYKAAKQLKAHFVNV